MTKRRTALLLIPGALAVLFARSARSNAEPGHRTTVPPIATAASGAADLKRLGPAHQVRTIAYRDQFFSVTTADGQTSDFWERDLHFKIDGSEAGPLHGAPVILPAGTVGDRAWVFFAAPDDISAFV